MATHVSNTHDCMRNLSPMLWKSKRRVYIGEIRKQVACAHVKITSYTKLAGQVVNIQNFGIYSFGIKPDNGLHVPQLCFTSPRLDPAECVMDAGGHFAAVVLDL